MHYVITFLAGVVVGGVGWMLLQNYLKARAAKLIAGAQADLTGMAKKL